jgi:Ca2+-transporting ATPase
MDEILGLSSEEVLASRKLYGSNSLTDVKKTSLWLLFYKKFDDPIIRILLIAAVISIVIGFIDGNLMEGITIIMAILIATGVAFLNDLGAQRQFDALTLIASDVLYRVLRNGVHTEILKSEIVVGDVLFLERGAEVPADGIILSVQEVLVNEVTLTGESKTVAKSVEEQQHQKTALNSNKVFRGTYIEEGSLSMRVEKVGDQTYVGQLAELTTQETQIETPLNRQLSGLAKAMGVVGFLSAGLIFSLLLIRDIGEGLLIFSIHSQWSAWLVLFISLVLFAPVWLAILADLLELISPASLSKHKAFRAYSWKKWAVLVALIVISIVFSFLFLSFRDRASFIEVARYLEIGFFDAFKGTNGIHLLGHFMVAMTILVMAVPEGLPLSVTLALSYSVKSMLRGGTLIRRMHAAETLGAVTTICTDKTGTLTQSIMSMTHTTLVATDEMSWLCLAVNSTADLSAELEIIGNPTEGAILVYINKNTGYDYDMLRHRASFVKQEPFNSDRKYMASSFSVDGRNIVTIKGAPEVVLARTNMDEMAQITILAQIKQFQVKGMRVLGMAYSDVTAGQVVSLSDVKSLSWQGFMVLSDPLRMEVPNTIRVCQKAGIDIKMVTGDNFDIAVEIARQAHILPEDFTFHMDTKARVKEGSVLTGVEFTELSDAEILTLLKQGKPHVLARSTPQDKMRLVTLLQVAGEVVAVTGDGTNDGPALNHADVGVAMGLTGTAIAKEAADIIITDDSFVSLQHGILSGRSLYANLQRFILFQLTIGIVALLLVVITSFLGLFLPLTVIQILWINMMMDSFAALALSTEPVDPHVMTNAPRNSNAFIITTPMSIEMGVMSAVMIGASLFLMHKYGNEPTLLQLTLFFNIFSFGQIWNLINVRYFNRKTGDMKNFFKNRMFVLIFLVIIVGQWMITQWGGVALRTTPLNFSQWVFVICITSPIFIVRTLIRVLFKH